MLEELSLRRVVVDGVILGVLLTALIIGSLWVEPTIWLEDYPPDVRAAVEGRLEQPTRLAVPVALAFLAIVVGVALWSTNRLRRENGGRLSPIAAFAHAFLLVQFFNLWDVVVIDWLIFIGLQPDFAVLPGTEGMAGYRDWWFHLRGSFLTAPPWIGSSMIGLLVAGLSRLAGRRDHGPRKDFV